MLPLPSPLFSNPLPVRYAPRQAGLSVSLVQRAAEKSAELEEQQRRVFARNLLARLTAIIQQVSVVACMCWWACVYGSV